ncbi:MAG: MFS transporter [Treponema sp.]|nr:MFS transporter [Treponema sp.]
MSGKRAVNIKASVLVFAIVLIIALVVNGVLGISGFEGVYRDALVSRYNIDGEYIKGKVEAALDLGKKLPLLESTVDPLFSDVLQTSSGLDHLYITDTSDKVLYTTRRVLTQTSMPFSYAATRDEGVDGIGPYVCEFLDSWFICIPLYFHGDVHTGTLYMEFSKRTVATFIAEFESKTLHSALAIFACSFLLYIILALLYASKSRMENLITIGLLLVSQVFFAINNNRLYNAAVSEVFNMNMSKLAQSISSDLRQPLKYMELENIGDVDSYLAARISGSKQCSDIYIIDDNLTIVHQAGQQPVAVGTAPDYENNDITIKSLPDVKGATMSLALRTNRGLINSILRDMALDSATIIIVALLFAFMLKNFWMLSEWKEDLLVAPESMDTDQESTALRLIQISTFVFMFAAYETLSFIPLYIKKVYDSSGGDFFGLTAETAQSIPVSAYMVGIMIAMFITLFAMKHLSVRRRYIIMSLVFVLGSVLTIISPELGLFSLARLICGFGFGGILLSTSSLVIEYTSARSRSAGFGTNAAAFASASIASIPVGGVIVNKFGYAAGIGVSIAFAVLFLLFALFCIPEAQQKNRSENLEDKSDVKNVSIAEFTKVFFSRHILVYIASINIPFQIIYWGLFQFLLPLYMSDTMKLSQGNIGRILGIFSIVSLFAVNASRLADRIKNDKLLISIGAGVAGLIMVASGLTGGGLLLFLAVMIAMGLDNLFIDSIEEVYLESGEVHGVSEENLLQCYKVIEKVLSVFIPSLTSLIIAFSGFNKSLMLIGLYSLAGAVLFSILGVNGRWRKSHEKD